jgi:hypothetical protein
VYFEKMKSFFNHPAYQYDVLIAEETSNPMSANEYGNAIYHRLEYLLTDIRSLIELVPENLKQNQLMFNNKTELEIYCNKLRVEIVDKLHNSENYESLLKKINIYENQYLKLLKAKADYDVLCERFIDLLTTYENLNKAKDQNGGIVNPQRYFNNMLINFELLRRNLAKQKAKYERYASKQKTLNISHYGNIYSEDAFFDLNVNRSDIKSVLTEKKLELSRLFDFKDFNLTYNQLQRVREVHLDDEYVYVCCTPFYYSEFGLLLQKFDKNSKTLLKSVEIERKFTFRNVIFDKNAIILLLKTSTRLFSYSVQVYDTNLNLQSKLKLNYGMNIISLSVMNDKLYVFTEFNVYIYNMNDSLKELETLKLDYKNYSSFKLNFIDQEFYRAKAYIMRNELVYYQDNSFGLSILAEDNSKNKIKSFTLSNSIDLVKFKNYELLYIDHLSRLYFLNSKQNSIIISSFDDNNKLEVIDEFNLGNVFNSISSIYVTHDNYLVINDYSNYRIYFYKIDI